MFLIDQMTEQLEKDGEDHPKNLHELNMWLRMARPIKRKWGKQWQRLLMQFLETFQPENVARKWNTLGEAYKKIKENNKTTGKGTIRFQFYKEMEELMGSQNYVVFQAVGTAEGLGLRRLEVLLNLNPRLVL